MKRIEIICDVTIEDELIRGLDSLDGISGYTNISPVKGTGNHGPRKGDHIWPEENSLIVIYLHDDKIELIQKLIDEKRTKFPRNGIAGFIIGSASEI